MMIMIRILPINITNLIINDNSINIIIITIILIMIIVIIIIIIIVIIIIIIIVAQVSWWRGLPEGAKGGRERPGDEPRWRPYYHYYY